MELANFSLMIKLRAKMFSGYELTSQLTTRVKILASLPGDFEIGMIGDEMFEQRRRVKSFDL